MASNPHFETLKALQAQPQNKVCVDCDTKNPQWATVNFGTFMCLDCSGKHRSLGTHISFVRSVGMDKWKDWEVERMKAGGNDAFRAFAKQNGIDRMDIREKYNTKAAAIYAAKLKSKATGEPYVEPPDPGTMRRAQPQSTSMGGGGGGGGSGSGMGSMGSAGMGASSHAQGDSWGWGSTTIDKGPGASVVGSGSDYQARASAIPASRAGGFSSADYQRMQGGGPPPDQLSNYGRHSDAAGGYGLDYLQGGLNSLREQYDSGQLQESASKTATQAAAQLSSWWNSASSYLTDQVNAVSTGQGGSGSGGGYSGYSGYSSAAGTDELRSTLQQNLRGSDAGQSSDSKFTGFGSNSMGSAGMGGGGNAASNVNNAPLSSNGFGSNSYGSNSAAAPAASTGAGYQQNASSSAGGNWDDWGFSVEKPETSNPQKNPSSSGWGWPDELSKKE